MSDTPTLKDLLTVPCGTCNSSGDQWRTSTDYGGTAGIGKLTVRGECPDCGGRGWLPAEGVQQVDLIWHGDVDEDTPGLWVPLSKLEVDE